MSYYDNSFGYDDDDDDYYFTRRRLINEREGIFLKTFDGKLLAQTQYYNKEEKKSTFSDITVKVQTQIYHLDKAILALKSAYFETLFTGDFEDKTYDVIEIHTIDEETFSSIVDYIYGADLRKEVINEHNFATLFMAMDYLQMEIDLEIFINFLTREHELDDKAVFQLYNFVSLLSKFKSITTVIHQHFANNLRKISNSSEFLSIAPTALIEVLYADTFCGGDANMLTNHQIREIYGEICVEWICHDFQKRLPHIIDLVNAIKRMFSISFAISNANYRVFEEPDETKRKKRVKKYFNRLLNHSVELRPVPAVAETGDGKTSEQSTSCMIEISPDEYTTVHEIDYAAKWKTYFKQQNFCDISIRAGDEIFQLHRIQLSLEIPYFHDLLSQSPNQNEYVLEKVIDGASFKKIIHFIYYEEIDLTNERHLVRLLRSCAILRIDDLKNKIYQYVKNNLNFMKDIFDFLSFTIENEEFYENLDELEMYIAVAWEEICKEPEFYETSIDVFEYVINLPNLRLINEHNLLNICSEWIHYDIKNRYQFIPTLALAINRGSEVALEKYNSVQHEEFCSTQRIKDQLKNILSSTQLVSTRISPLACDLAEELMPCFMILKDEEISIMNSKFEEINIIPLLSPIQEKIKNFELSATIVNDNLFTLLVLDRQISFLAYNIRSKKVTSLTFNCEMNSANFHLISHNNELYFYADKENYIWKYSSQLNRWIRLFNIEVERSQFITSNGKILYRILENQCVNDGEVQSYEFEKQSWVKPGPVKHVEYLPSYYGILDVSFTDEDFIILFDYCTAIYRQELRKWKLITYDEEFTSFKQLKDSIIHIRELRNRDSSVVTYEKDSIEFHSFSIVDEQWQLKKKVQMKYKKIVPVHSVQVMQNQLYT